MFHRKLQTYIEDEIHLIGKHLVKSYFINMVATALFKKKTKNDKRGEIL